MRAMKRTGIFLAAMLFATTAVFAQVSYLAPRDARSMGMGGAFTVFSTGYSSFFGNPAGFAGKGSFTISDASVWAYFDPSTENVAKAMRIVNGIADVDETAATMNEFMVGNGVGGGTSLGLGWAGGGFGFGAFMVSDAFIHGTTAVEAKVVSRNSINAVLGIGLPLIKTPLLSLELGADVRPFFRIDSTGSGWSGIDILRPIIEFGNLASVHSQIASGGFGIAMDFGGTLSVGPLLFGVAVRDVAPAFKMGEGMIGDWLVGNYPTDYDSVKLNARLYTGLGFRLDPFPGLLSTEIYAEIREPLAVVKGEAEILRNLHAGASLRLLDAIVLRGGLNSGYLSFGAGLDLVIFEVDAAIFTEELGTKIGDFKRSGLAVQAAIRL